MGPRFSTTDTLIGTLPPALQKDLDRLSAKNIPTDVVFEQGLKVLGLQ